MNLYTLKRMFYIEHSKNCKVYNKCANKIIKEKKGNLYNI